jgi:RNA polymerase sigma factor (sigma-70 family)
MPSKNFYRGLDPILIKAVRYHAKRLKRYPCFAGLEVEDLEQELLMEVLPSLVIYDETRSQWKTFLSSIITKRAINLLIRAQRGKRAAFHFSLPLELYESAEEEVNEALLYSSLMPQRHDSYERLECQIDIDRILPHLSPEAAALCIQLKSATLSEIARTLGCPRSSLYSLIEEIERAFENAGLKSYLTV